MLTNKTVCPQGGAWAWSGGCLLGGVCLFQYCDPFCHLQVHTGIHNSQLCLGLVRGVSAWGGSALWGGQGNIFTGVCLTKGHSHGTWSKVWYRAAVCSVGCLLQGVSLTRGGYPANPRFVLHLRKVVPGEDFGV